MMAESLQMQKNENRSFGDDDEEITMEWLIGEMDNCHFPSGPTYKVQQQTKAVYEFTRNDILKGIYHLTESHCPTFRYKASELYEKSVQDTGVNIHPMVRDNFATKCRSSNTDEHIQNLLNKIEEMPSEWTLVQITPIFTPEQQLEGRVDASHTCPLYVTVFSCGQREDGVFTMGVEAPKMEIVREVWEASQAVKDGFGRFKSLKNAKIRDQYARFKYSLNDRMKQVVTTIENHWLSIWRVLFIGKYVDRAAERKIDDIARAVTKYTKAQLDKRERTLLKYLIKGKPFIDYREFVQAVNKLFPSSTAAEQKEIRHIIEQGESFQYEKRNPVILIVDESIDIVPWEQVNTIKDHPISRMQSLHFTYGLYKEHEATIIDGFKIIDDPNNSAFLLNPALDLQRTENRLTSFVKYWVPTWDLIAHQEPSSDSLLALLQEKNIFCYSGHGDGFKYIPSQQLQKLRVNSVVLLFGCSSVCLKSSGPQCEPMGSHQNYMTACSPCVVGMLWPVTDTDTDFMTAEFLSQWVPSEAEVHWQNLVKSSWESGNAVVDVSKMPRNRKPEGGNEPELLRALVKSRKAARQFITQAACVARGIPVKIEKD